jgi:hypothetical protein
MKTLGLVVLVAGLGLAGCATMDDFGSAGRQAVRNEQGHVIGYKDILKNKKSGEVVAQVHMFTPMRDDAGDIIGYEEETRDGAVIRDLRGRAIGNRFTDMRSRNTNMRSRGVTIVIGGLDTRRLITDGDRPKIHDLMASLSAADLSALR